MNLEYIEQELNKLMNKALKYDDVPVAAIVVYNNKIIGRGYNKVKNKNNILNHAEILAIRQASKKIHNWRLNDCQLYVTLEPCSMCKEIIKKSRISNVYYFSKQNNEKTELDPNYKYINNNDFSTILTNFFKDKR